MPLCVVDTSVLLPGLLSERPFSHRRKLMVVFAYGALAYGEHVLREEVELMAVTAGLPDPAGETLARHILAGIEHRRAALVELLPADTPDDFLLVGSKHLYDEVERTVAEKGQAINPRLPAGAAAMVRRQVEAITGYPLALFDKSTVPRHTSGRDRDDDVLVEMAVRAEAVIVSDDKKHISLGEPYTTYADEQRGVEVRAYRFDNFLDEFVWSRFDLGQIDPDALRIALQQPGP